MAGLLDQLKSLMRKGEGDAPEGGVDPNLRGENDPKSLKELAHMYEQRQDWAAAITTWRQLLDGEPTHVQAKLGLAQALIAGGEQEEALLLYRQILDTPVQTDLSIRNARAEHELKVRARHYENLNLWQDALGCWQALLQDFPTSLEAALAIGQNLIELGEFAEARMVYGGLIERFANKSALWKGLAYIAQLEMNWLAGDLYWEKIFQLGGRAQDLLRQHITYLLAKSDFAKALEIYQAELSNTQSLESGLMLADIYAAAKDTDGALAVFEELAKTYGPNKRGLRNKKMACLADAGRADEAIKVMLNVTDITKAQVPALARLIQLYIQNDQCDEALALLDQIPAEWYGYRGIANCLAWKCARAGDGDAARAAWNRVAYRPLHQSAQSMRIKVHKDHWPDTVTGKHRLRLYAHVRNEETRLPAFLEHYRALGVKEFFVIDNDSEDGTRDYLRQQDDVVSFATQSSFIASQSGAYWINDLIESYQVDGWALYVDVDDYLILPDEEISLAAFLDARDAAGDELIVAQTIDLFPKTLGEAGIFGNEGGRDTDELYFDTDMTCRPTVMAPYIRHEGGIHHRFFAPAPVASQTKVPLIRADRGVRFMDGAAMTTPGKVSKVQIGLLHTKWSGDVRARAAKDVRTTAAWPRGRAFAAYRHVLETMDDNASLLGPHSVRFENAAQLGTLGIIRAD